MRRELGGDGVRIPQTKSKKVKEYAKRSGRRRRIGASQSMLDFQQRNNTLQTWRWNSWTFFSFVVNEMLLNWVEKVKM